jgi:siroheme synthase
MQLVARMLEQGFPADTPAAIVQSATVKEQKSVRTTIGGMEAAVAAAGLSSPAVITVGGVAKALDGTAALLPLESSTLFSCTSASVAHCSSHSAGMAPASFSSMVLNIIINIDITINRYA